MAGEFNVGSVVARFKADMSDFNKGLKSAQDGLKKGSSDMKANLGRIKEGIQEIGVVAGVAFAGLTLAINQSVKASNRYDNALLGLRSVATKTGNDFNDVERALDDLTKDGLLPVTDASTALKNLLATGFSLDEAITLMEGFKDSAAFGRQGALNFGEAIVGATEGIKNQNSILVDNAGITKNLSVILREQGKSVNDLQNVTSDASVRQALFNGLLEEFNLFTGDAQKLSEEFAGEQAKLDKEMQDLYRTVGRSLKPQLSALLRELIPLIRGFRIFIEENPRLASNLILVATAVTGLLAGLAGFLAILGPIVSGWKIVVGVIGLFTAPAWGVVAAITAVVAAIVLFIVNIKKIEYWSQQAGSWLRVQFNKAVDYVNGLLSRFSPATLIRIAIFAIFGIHGLIATAIYDGFNKGIDWVNGLLSRFNPLHWLQQKINAISGWAGRAREAIVAPFRDAVNDINSRLQSIQPKIPGTPAGQGSVPDWIPIIGRFATGGIVPGASFSGDRVLAAVNSGEMILNRQQQSNLFEMLQGGIGGAGVTIQNVNIQNRQDADYFLDALDKRQRLAKLGAR